MFNQAPRIPLDQLLDTLRSADRIMLATPREVPISLEQATAMLKGLDRQHDGQMQFEQPEVRDEDGLVVASIGYIIGAA